jgi:hypothetical protein
MAITLADNDVRNAVCKALVDFADAGGGANGKMQIFTAGFALLLVEIGFVNPAFGALDAGVATLRGTPLTGIASATGTAALFRVVDTDDSPVYSGTVGIGGSGADAIIDSTSITTGDTVQLNAHTVSAPD